MDRKFDLLTLGEIMLRLSPQNNERIAKCKMFEKHIGGVEEPIDQLVFQSQEYKGCEEYFPEG